MLTDKERQEDKEFQEKLEAKLGKKFGHAIPKVDRNRPIENNFEFKPLDRQKLENPLKDINIEEYKLWREFNNKEERNFRSQDAFYIDEPGIDSQEIERRIKYNKEKLIEITQKQIKQYPELFKEFLKNDSDS